MDNENKDLDYYLNLNWTLIEGQDLDFDGNPYYYIEIKEIPFHYRNNDIFSKIFNN